MNSVSAIKRELIACTLIPQCLVNLVACYARPEDVELFKYLCCQSPPFSDGFMNYFASFEQNEIIVYITPCDLNNVFYVIEHFRMDEFQRGCKDRNSYQFEEFIEPCEKMITELKHDYEAMIYS